MWKDASGNPIDLTGLKARMQVRERLTDEDVLLELTDEKHIDLGGDAGTITIEADASVTAGWTFQSGTYSLMIGEDRLAEGMFRVKDGATHE